MTIKILFLAANPQELDRLALAKEIQSVKTSLKTSKFREEFSLEQEWAVNVDSLFQAMLEHRPQIVHFSGHGTQTGQIFLEGKTGFGDPVDPEELAGLFSNFDDIRCVVLNACYSEKQADEIVKHIDFVVGMIHLISDESAANFAPIFYLALAEGYSVNAAFELARTRIAFDNRSESVVPILRTNTSADNSFCFVPKLDTPKQDDQVKQNLGKSEAIVTWIKWIVVFLTSLAVLLVLIIWLVSRILNSEPDNRPDPLVDTSSTVSPTATEIEYFSLEVSDQAWKAGPLKIDSLIYAPPGDEADNQYGILAFYEPIYDGDQKPVFLIYGIEQGFRDSDFPIIAFKGAEGTDSDKYEDIRQRIGKGMQVYMEAVLFEDHQPHGVFGEEDRVAESNVTQEPIIRSFYLKPD